MMYYISTALYYMLLGLIFAAISFLVFVPLGIAFWFVSFTEFSYLSMLYIPLVLLINGFVMHQLVTFISTIGGKKQ